MRRSRSLLALLAIVSLLVAACARGGGPAPAASGGGNAGGQQFEMKLGHATAKDAQDGTANFFVQEVARRTNNRIKGAVYNNSQIGNNQQMNQAIRSGAQEAIIQPAGFMSTYAPEVGVLDLPFLFPDDATQVKVLNGPGGDAIRKAAEREGVVIITFIPGGFKNFSTTFPINKAEDLKGHKLRVIQSPELVAEVKAFGAVGIPMALPEVYTAIQQGTVEGQENPEDVIYALKFYEVAPYFTISRHGALSTVIAVSKKWYDSLPSDLQQALMEAGKTTSQESIKIYQKSRDDAMAAMKAANVKVSELPKSEVDKLKELSTQVWSEIRSDPKKAPIIDAIEKAVKG